MDHIESGHTAPGRHGPKRIIGDVPRAGLLRSRHASRVWLGKHGIKIRLVVCVVIDGFAGGMADHGRLLGRFNHVVAGALTAVSQVHDHAQFVHSPDHPLAQLGQPSVVLLQPGAAERVLLDVRQLRHSRAEREEKVKVVERVFRIRKAAHRGQVLNHAGTALASATLDRLKPHHAIQVGPPIVGKTAPGQEFKRLVERCCRRGVPRPPVPVVPRRPRTVPGIPRSTADQMPPGNVTAFCRSSPLSAASRSPISPPG